MVLPYAQTTLLQTSPYDAILPLLPEIQKQNAGGLEDYFMKVIQGE